MESDACFNTGGARDRRFGAEGLRCRLDFRPPLAWENLLTYLRKRAIPGVESVNATHYRRTVDLDGHRGWVGVSLAGSGTALHVDMAPGLAPVIGGVIARVKQLFDLDAVPDAVMGVLAQDPRLTPIVRRLPGLRVPGAFDGFELGVRAVLGQQVSVRAATTMAGRWAKGFGAAIETPFPGLDRLSPPAPCMAGIDAEEIAALGIFGARARCIAALARAVTQRQVVLSSATNVDAQVDQLLRLPGIGPWTAQYIAMRALHWPDAFPSGDVMLLKAARMTRGELCARAELWRPWRAYAAHYLWQSLGSVP